MMMLWFALFAAPLLGAAQDCQGDACNSESAAGDALLQLGKKRTTLPLKTSGEEHEPRVVKTFLDKGKQKPATGNFLYVNATKLPGTKLAKVELVLKNGRRLVYKLRESSAFSEDAKIEAHGGGKMVSRTMEGQSYSSSLNGRSAKVRIYDDGSVMGLFQVGPRILQLSRSKGSETGVAALQNMGGIKHAADIMLPSDVASITVGKLSHMMQKTQDDPEVAVDDEGPEEHHIGDSDVGIMEAVGDDQEPEAEIGANTESWGGTPWFPGCYPGDSTRHVLKIGVAADYPAFSSFGAQTQSIMHDIVHQASLIYELQMNIKLEIAQMVTYEEEAGAPAWAVGCADNFMADKLEKLTSDTVLPFQGVWHVFTDCGTDFGVVGLAYIGTVCLQQPGERANTGVNQIRTHRANPVLGSWTTFAHELGHNFHGRHSFEEGQGNTGGIMDYGDGKLDGVYQFNTKYRKTEMCGHIAEAMSRCGNKLVVDLSAATEPYLLSGPCQAVDGSCFTSPNYPQQYPVNQECRITVIAAGTTIRVDAFNTEPRYDYMVVNGNQYSGQTGPNGVRPEAGSAIIWSSDYSETSTGWKICLDGLTAATTPAPTTPAPTTPAPTTPAPTTPAPTTPAPTTPAPTTPAPTTPAPTTPAPTTPAPTTPAPTTPAPTTPAPTTPAPTTPAPTTPAQTTPAPTTPAPTTPVPTVPGGEQRVKVTSGDCQVRNDCVTSPNFGNGNYGNNKACAIEVLKENSMVTATSFQTEANWDILKIGEREFSGIVGPFQLAVSPGTSITWASDVSVALSGWSICFEEKTSAGSAENPTLVSGNCQVEGNCMRSPHYPDPYHTNEACLIQVPQGKTVQTKAFCTEYGYDILVLNGNRYSGCGSNAPTNVVTDGSPVEWHSDFSYVSTGWELCLV